ncbi:MAG TPA: AAA family ATPase, partial [Solirubrobacter sp.]|nr:AAA family ATPase [Solirubrobacter sp.]
MTTELAGRAAELAALAELVRTLRRGGRIGVVEGEAGIGKTRLLEAAGELARAAGVTVLAGRGEELEARRPFGPLVDCVGRERLERHLGDWEVRPDAAAERQFSVAETVLERLDELSVRGPVLLVVEDLHWADPATLAVLARVAAGIAALPAGLLVSLRPQPRGAALDALLGALAERGARIVRLGPLDAAATAELVAGLIGVPPGARLALQAGRAAGNPLFICELVAGLQAAGAIRDGELATTGPVPALPLTILHRLSFLARDALDLLGLAAVLGASFDAADLALLAGRPLTELLGPLRTARRAGVIVARDERLAFRHELVRDALYEDVPLSVRRGLHVQAAAALTAASRPPESVAEHVLRSARPGDERAVAALSATA